MQFVRWLILLLLVASAVLFAFYAGTAQERYKHLGLIVLKWTVVIGLVFFAGMFIEKML